MNSETIITIPEITEADYIKLKEGRPLDSFAETYLEPFVSEVLRLEGEEILRLIREEGMNRREAIIAMANGSEVEDGDFVYGFMSDGSLYKRLVGDEQDYGCNGLPAHGIYETYKPKVKRKIERWVNVYKNMEYTHLTRENAEKYAGEGCLVVAAKMEIEVEVEQ